MENTPDLLKQVTYGLITFTLSYLILWYGSFIFIPLTWGVFFAFALFPVSHWLEENRFPRGLAILTTLILFSISIFGVLFLVINQMVSLLADIPEIGKLFQTKLSSYLLELEELTGMDMSEDDTSSLFANWISGENLNQTIFNTGKSLTLIGIVPLFIFLLLYYRDFFVAFLLQASERSNDKILAWVGDSGKIIHQYLIGMVKVTGIVTILSGTFFYFMDIKYYLLFALFISVMNLIPYIGVIISSFLVIVYVFLTSDTLFYPLLTLGVLWGIQVLENNLITPIVVGSKVRVNVLAVVLGILVGGSIWGVSGMVLSIPLVGILKITLDRIPSLTPYGYLLGDDFPIHEKHENFLRILRRKLIKK
ncbi:MAG TPA: AI-2E family transporter [Lunatimonas sp.]|nr:AI-2E family transporter [Lunatimonas sp.]